jgi:hypothetical protein
MIPRKPRLLHIYDADDSSIVATAWIRRHQSILDNIFPVPINGGEYALRIALNKLVADGETFSHALFETHGDSGSIQFNGEDVTADTLMTSYVFKNYEKIFPYFNARIYFNGCDVADDPNGWKFLDAAGSIFLRIGGGTTFAQTGLGRPIIFTGHVVHFGSTTCYSSFLPGGKLIGHSTD